MEYIRRVEDRAGGGLDQEGAELAIRATLATLAERISAKEASDLAAQLPKEFKHVRAVTNVLAEAVTGHELEDVRATLPDEFATLFQPPAAVNWPDAHAHRPHP
jgi:uncharacterized protein (DUF2267 family)